MVPEVEVLPTLLTKQKSAILKKEKEEQSEIQSEKLNILEMKNQMESYPLFAESFNVLSRACSLIIIGGKSELSKFISGLHSLKECRKGMPTMYCCFSIQIANYFRLGVYLKLEKTSNH